jgi:hypothetical protein
MDRYGQPTRADKVLWCPWALTLLSRAKSRDLLLWSASVPRSPWALQVVTTKFYMLGHIGPTALKLRPDLIEDVESHLCFRFDVWPW